jgi:hypothetical protein
MNYAEIKNGRFANSAKNDSWILSLWNSREKKFSIKPIFHGVVTSGACFAQYCASEGGKAVHKVRSIKFIGVLIVALVPCNRE